MFAADLIEILSSDSYLFASLDTDTADFTFPFNGTRRTGQVCCADIIIMTGRETKLVPSIRTQKKNCDLIRITPASIFLANGRKSTWGQQAKSVFNRFGDRASAHPPPSSQQSVQQFSCLRPREVVHPDLSLRVLKGCDSLLSGILQAHY